LAFDPLNSSAGYVSQSNPWSTADSAFFPNGITTAGAANWIYGSTTFIGNAPSNGFGHQFNASSGASNAYLAIGGGNVGIGTTSPNTALSVRGPAHFYPSGTTPDDAYKGSLRITQPAASGQYINLVSAGTYPWSIGMVYNTSNFAIGQGQVTDSSFTSPFFTIASYSGNVGIGTTNPGDRLEVFSGTNKRFVVGAVNSYTSPFDFNAGGTYMALSRPEDGALTSVMYSYNSAGGAKNNMAFSSRSDIVFLTGSGPNNSIERMRLLENGNVGVGTTAPTAHLTISGNSIDNGSTGIDFTNTSGNDTFRLAAGIPGVTNSNFSISQGGTPEVVVANGSGYVGIGVNNPSVALDVHGDIQASGVIKAKYQDVAEWVPSSQPLSAGTVVVLDSTKSNQVISSTKAYDTRVAGVVSEKPGIALGESGANKVLVATTGRVLVNVDASNGPIHIGDLLVTSDTSGLAMKSEPITIGNRKMHMPGTLVGKALEPLEKGAGRILVLLSLQ